MQSSRETFKKCERLCRKKQIEQLFATGHSFVSYPLRIQYLLVTATDQSPSKVLFPVPKKRIKKAVKRNLVRRRMREAFRLNKADLYQAVPEGQQLLMAFIYLDDLALDYSAIEKGIRKAFRKLNEDLKRVK